MPGAVWRRENAVCVWNTLVTRWQRTLGSPAEERLSVGCCFRCLMESHGVEPRDERQPVGIHHSASSNNELFHLGPQIYFIYTR